jgi:sodium/bile acid cotransporter 7
MSNTPSSTHESTLARASSPIPASADGKEAAIKADSTSQSSRKRPPPIWKRIISYLIAQWLVFGLGLAVLLAWAFPSVGKNGGHLRAEYTIKWGAIAVIFLLTGLSLSTRAFLNQALNFHLHIVTQFISFIIFSAVTYGVVWCIVASGNSHLDRVVIGGIITMGVLPTTL